MKKIIHYLFPVLLLIIFSAARAQDAPKPATDENMNSQGKVLKNQEQQVDPKWSPEERERNLHGGSNNPTRPLMMSDPKQMTDNNMGKTCSAPSRPAMIEDPKRPLYEMNNTYNDVQSHVASSPEKVMGSQNRPQPEGAAPARMVNLRDIKGSRFQPSAPMPDNVQNYRNIQGTHSQPKGELPAK
jgi:hypothetical protein